MQGIIYFLPFFLAWSRFLLLDLLMFDMKRLWTDMELMYPLAEHQQQCQRNLCFHPCYYRASLWLWQFLWGDHKLVAFAPSSLCLWNQRLWRNLQTRVLPLVFLHKLHLWFDELLEAVMLWIDFSENHFDSF